MATVTLSCYEITITKKGEKDTPLSLSDFNNGNDLFNFLKNYIPNWNYETNSDSKIVDDEELQKVLRLRPNTISFYGRTISGIVETGEYGYESDIINKETGKQTHKRTRNEASMLPFYFIIQVHRNFKKGILILQRFKQFGVYSIFSTTLRKEFQNQNEDYLLSFNPLVSKELVDKFIDGGIVSRISFKNLNGASQLSSYYDDGIDFDESDLYTEFNIIAKRGKKLPFLGKIKKFRSGNIDIGNLVSINDFEYNTVSVTITLNGHRRTMDLSALNKLGAFYDITNEINFNEVSGHPDFDLVAKQAKEILEDIKVTIFPHINSVTLSENEE